jgi:hypothetical protein
MFSRSLILWLLSWSLLFTTTTISAFAKKPVSLEYAATEAKLIFQGTVTKIASRKATDFGSNYDNEYYAFVTFRIERFFKGSVENNLTTFTLPTKSCFVGDPHKQPSTEERRGEGSVCLDRYIEPSFKVGEKAFLFVGISEKNLYSIEPVETKEGNTLLTQPYLETKQVAKKHRRESAKVDRHLKTENFAKIIEQKLQYLQQNKLIPLPPPVKSADFDNPIYYRSYY